MRSLTTRLVLVLSFVALGWLILAQGQEPANPRAGSAPTAATKDELDQLRAEVAAQKQTIEELKAMVGRLAESTAQAANSAQASTDGVRLLNATYLQPDLMLVEQASQAAASPQAKPKPPKPSDRLEWNIAGTTVQLYGYADVSYDYVDNGITRAMEANNPLIATFPNIPARANNGWLGQVSSNLSYFGVRGSHKINDHLKGVFQFETEVMFVATPGSTSDLQCKFCLGSRDSYVGVEGPWGAFKVGKENDPFKKAIIPIDPFYRTIADHRSIMGNSGGDNRAEFEPRLSHSIWYESPTFYGFSGAVLFSPGMNRSADNGAYPRVEPNCSGGNGAFTLSFQNQANVAEGADLYSVAPPDINPCNDGSYGNALSTAITYKAHGLYAFGAYEHHAGVNRTTDLVGVADEAAWRLGLSYTYEKTGTTGTFVYDNLKRYAANSISAVDGQPIKFAALDERSRPLATMVVLSQKLFKKDVLSAEWIHAGKTPGDPGQCVTVTNGACTGFATLAGVPGTADSVANTVNNSSNQYAFGLKHTLTPNVAAYFVAARQANHADAHYDLGAGGHDAVVDKRDFTGKGFPGTRLQGVSAGMTFRF